TLGPVLIKGSLLGNSTQPALITGLGQAHPGNGIDLAITSITVGGRVERALILAGYSARDQLSGNVVPLDADAQIGSIPVGGDWIASSVAAGVVDGGNGFGNSGDAKFSEPGGDDPTIVSRIRSISIGGAVLGTAASGDHFGFVAEQIGSFTLGGEVIPLTTGK